MTDIKFLMEALKSRASHCVSQLITHNMAPRSFKCENNVFQWYEDYLGRYHFSNYAFQTMIDAYNKLKSIKAKELSKSDYQQFNTYELTQMVKASYANQEAVSELVDALNMASWNIYVTSKPTLAETPKLDYAQAFLNKDVNINYFFN